MIGDLFLSAVSDVKVKSQQDLMSRNFFSLTKNRIDEIEHIFGSDFVHITGRQNLGVATIWDYDILLFLISQVVDKKNKRMALHRRIRFTLYDFLKWKGSTRSFGNSYERFMTSLRRLQGTHVRTSIRRRNTEADWEFYWISELRAIQFFDENQTKSRAEFECVLAEWVFESIVKDNLILTIDRDYFRLSSGLERWLYLFARKSAGSQKKGWSISFEQLHEKSASRSSLRDFKKQVKRIVDKNQGLISGYWFTYDDTSVNMKVASSDSKKLG